MTRSKLPAYDKLSRLVYNGEARITENGIARRVIEWNGRNYVCHWFDNRWKTAWCSRDPIPCEGD